MRRASMAGRWKRLAVVGALAAAGTVLVLVAWTRVTASSGYCASCHTMEVASATAAKSVHADVTCIACHGEGAGARAAVGYVPTLMREVVQEVTGREWANGVMRATACTTCHDDLSAAGDDGGRRHPGPTSQCTTCHGDVVHPGQAAPAPDPHPDGYGQTHGRDAVRDRGNTTAGTNSCATCHEPEVFCASCHFRTDYPHSDAWVSEHGGVAASASPEACVLCHSPRTFCRGCHGTEIPHAPTWLGEHGRAIQSTTERPCTVCHQPADCANCHTSHDTHRERRVASAPGPGP